MNTILQNGRVVLPKPVIFGLWGAGGCCLAALLLGELLWRLLAPPPAPPPTPVLRMAG
jgi:hypothetical protein